MDALAERVERADLGQRVELVLLQADASREFSDRPKRTAAVTLRDEPCRRLGAQHAHVHQTETDARSGFPRRPRAPCRIVADSAPHARLVHVDRQHPDAVPLRVFHQHRRRVEPHRLAVQQGREELRGIVRLQVRTGVRQQGETGRVGLREAVERERGNRAHDLVGRRAFDAVPRQAPPQPPLKLAHALDRALEPHGAPELLGLPAREARRGHRDAQQLLLEQWHAQRALENRHQRRVRVAHGLPPETAVDVRMHHVARDRAGTNDRHLHDQVVEAGRADTRQGGHLGAALDLEHADRVGALDHAVGLGIVRRDPGEIERTAARPDDGGRFLQRRHHAQAQQVHLDNAEIRAILLVPLHHHAARHARVLERHDGIQIALADHHAAGMLPEMARQAPDIEAEPQPVLDARVAAVEADFPRLMEQVVVAVHVLEPADALRELADHLFRESEDLAHLPHGALAAIGDDIGRHAGPALAVALVNVLDHALALVPGRQIDIDVGPFAALLREEPLEEQVHADGIDSRDPQRVADRGIGGRPPPLAENACPAGELHQFPDDQEIALQPELGDDRELAVDLAQGLVPVRRPAVALGRSAQRRRAEERSRTLS